MNLATASFVNVNICTTFRLEELFPLSLAFLISIAEITRQYSIRDVIAAVVTASYKVIQVSLAILTVEYTSTICTTRFEVGPKIPNLLGGRRGVDNFP